MKIDLSRKEYRDLIDMLYIAAWILNANDEDGEDPRTKRYGKVEQKFFALAKAMEYENLIEYDPEDKDYFITWEYEETSSAHAFIDEYKDDTFWRELIIRMAERDLANQVGGYNKIAALSVEKRAIRLRYLEEFYGEEFSRNGLKNLLLRGGKQSPQTGKTIH